MDYRETIDVLINHERYVGVKCVNGVEEAYITPYFEKALNIAISAMQELQEYHKTGLCPKQVTETICELGATKRVLEHFQQIGTLEEVREAVDKQKEERPIKVLGTFGGEEYECKNCGSPVEYLNEYCRCCGQKLDWSEEEKT